jgi:lysine-N-methylase
MTGYEDADIREYLENSFASPIWDWGYFALVVGK